MENRMGFHNKRKGEVDEYIIAKRFLIVHFRDHETSCINLESDRNSTFDPLLPVAISCFKVLLSLDQFRRN